MGKTKQVKEKKFDRNVEISAPILDPEIIKAIHTPPKGQRLDIRHGGFKALLSDLNSQDSMDELTPINDNHVPSYIGISCAVSGYSNYSSYNKKPLENITNAATTTAKTVTRVTSTPSRSQTSSPIASRIDHHVKHITIDKSNIHSPDEERRKLTEELTASATERRRSPSPIPPTEDDRHHGAYVGARYCPMPPPSKVVNKHIPLLGIDDDQDPDEVVTDDTNKVEQKIASLYGDNFVEDWRESMSHKSKKEHVNEQQEDVKSPKDLVTLRPAPNSPEPKEVPEVVDVPVPNVKVLAGVEKQFLNRLLTDENPPMPKSPSPQPASPKSNVTTKPSNLIEDRADSPKVSSFPPEPSPPVTEHREELIFISSDTPNEPLAPQQLDSSSPPSPSPQLDTTTSPIEGQVAHEAPDNNSDDEYGDRNSPTPMSPDSGKNQSINEEGALVGSQVVALHNEEHIEYEIRAESPVGNESSPVRVATGNLEPVVEETSHDVDEKLVSFSPEPIAELASNEPQEKSEKKAIDQVGQSDLSQTVDGGPAEEIAEKLSDTTIELTTTSVDNIETTEAPQPDVTTVAGGDDNNNGLYYLNLLDQEESFIVGQVERAESLLAERESELDEDTVGRIRSAIGKANLLVNKKCNQFKELCERSINEGANEQFAVLNDDLAGFWDMLSIQINDVRKSFENLY